MNIGDLLQQSGALDSISKQLGVSPATAQSGAEALLPAILGGFKKQAQPDAGGLGGLMDIVGGLGGGGLLDSLTNGGATSAQPGNEILGQIFGSKDVSRTVAGQASQSTGLDPALLQKMLPLLAMLVSGYLARQGGGAGQGGGLGSILGQVLGGGQAAQPSSGSLGGLGSLLDLDGDGNPLDDILGMAGKLMR